MTPIFSWMLTRNTGQVRFVLADDVLIEMTYSWDDTNWRVVTATLNDKIERARSRALQRTETLEDAGFTLDGSVCILRTEAEASALYVENAHRDIPGVILRSLFTMTWEEM